MGGTELGSERKCAERLSAKRGAQVAIVASKQFPVVGRGVRGPFESELRGLRGGVSIGENSVQGVGEARRRQERKGG
jgi:hypothetical protein